MALSEGRFQQHSLTSSEWTAADPVLQDGEIGVADAGSSTPILKVGDGVRPWSALPPISGGSGGSGQDYVVGSTTTLAPGSFATVTIDNSESPPTISFGIPRGDVGPANALSIGTVTTGAPGSPASATITGTPPAQTLSFTIPQGLIGADGDPGAEGATGPTGPTGPVGPANSLTIGTVTTGAPGTAAAATITGTPPTQVLDLTIPTGSQGPPGGANFADPSVLVGLTVVAGLGNNAMRADSAPALSQAIAPTWTGAHTFDGPVNLAGLLEVSGAEGVSGQVIASQGPGLPAVWRSPGGGSIELGYNFNTSTANANPGAQKLSFNASSYAGTTSIYFNATAFTNFDANTILSLLQPGNRVYIQQRNDATKAVVFEVTGAGTNNAGWWTIPVALVNSLGTLFPNNADLNAVFMLSTSASVTFANPTATVGLVAVNGVAATAMRSDAAPALSLAISPTWTGQHVFAFSGSSATPNILVSSPAPNYGWYEDDAAANNRRWDVRASSEQLLFRVLSDDGSTSATFLVVDRTLNVIDSLGFTATLAAFSGAVSAAGQFRAGDGTVGAPAYSYIADQDTGWYRPISDTLLGVAGGAPAFGFDTTGVYVSANHTLYIQNGTPTNPAIRFDNDADTGLILGATGDLRIVTGGTAKIRVVDGSAMTVRMVSGQLGLTNGTAAAPSLGFESDPATGFYLWTTNGMAFVSNGSPRFYIGPSWLQGAVPYLAASGSAALPGIAFDVDQDTGIWRNGSDTISLSCGGVQRFAVTTTFATCTVPFDAPSFTTTSARASKRETGALAGVRDILARLRPILYRLLEGDDREQVGLVAEEVHDACPQLSDGKTVAYDRLAILLLAAWQDEHAERAAA